MKRTGLLILVAVLQGACATEVSTDLLGGHEEVEATTVIDAPSAVPGTYAPQNRDAVERGEYMVELLGCGACHTNGALQGDPDLDKALAGSQTGIAFSSPMGSERPGVVYPPNITPDEQTGIGDWTDSQVANAIRAGIGRHGSQRIASMPWQGYARLTDDDVDAIVSYLRSIEPVVHATPQTVAPGKRARHPFVYFGVYQSKP